MLRCCRDENALAAVLAHEIGHVENNHGLRAISKSRLTSAATILATESAKNLGGQQLADLTKTFEGSITDITSTMVNSGYSRQFESQADACAVATLQRAGYSPRGLLSMLSEMEKRLKPGGTDFAKTHPPPEVRIAAIRKLIDDAPPLPPSLVRDRRFALAMKGI